RTARLSAPSHPDLTLDTLPHELPSFPTRRSSDLTTRTVSPLVTWILTRSALIAWRVVLRFLADFRCFRMRAVSEPLRGERDDLQDRKSTRLNSSHVSVSYSVFCLKKKIAAGSTAT